MFPPDPIYIFKGGMGPVSCLMVKSRDEYGFLYAGTQTGEVHVWDLKTNREIAKMTSSTEGCIAIHSLGDTDEVITQDKVGVIRFWTENCFSWILTKELKTEYYGFCKCVLFQDVLYVPLKKNCIECILIETKERISLYNFNEHNKMNEIMSLKIFHKDDERFALIACENCNIYLWSMKSEKRLSYISVDECPMALDFDSVNMKGAFGSPTEQLLIFTVNKDFQLELERRIVLINPGIASLAIRPDGKLLAVGCWDGKLRLYSMKNFSLLAVLDVHSSTVQDLLYTQNYSDDSRLKFYLTAASKDCKISLWDLYN